MNPSRPGPQPIRVAASPLCADQNGPGRFVCRGPSASGSSLRATILRPTDLEWLGTRVRAAHPSLVGFLTAHFGYRDRERWTDALHRGEVAVDDRVVLDDVALSAGQRVAIAPADRAEDEPSVDVLFGDGRYVAIDKPPSLVCVRLSAFPRRTFVRRLERSLGAEADPPRLEPVHRLDRGTSGVVLLARDREAFTAMRRTFEAREVRKTYLALVDGDFPSGELRVDEAIGRHPRGVVAAQQALQRDGAIDPRPASTCFERVTGDGARTLLRATPTTGRTHQIRVHLAGLGFPIVGDLLYGAPAETYRAYARDLAAREASDPGLVARHLLHAHRLEFRHPFDGRPIAIEAPIPQDIGEVLGTAIG